MGMFGFRIFGADRRRHRRILATDDFFVEFPYQDEINPVSGCGRDISEEGVRFAAHREVPVGSQIHLTFRFSPKFPIPKSIKVAAEVRRCYIPKGATRYRIACHLDHKDDYTRALVKDFMSWRSKQGYATAA